MDVDAGQERAGDAAKVVSCLKRSAAALLLGMAIKSAGAGIHGAGKNKLGREAQAHGRPCNGNFSILRGCLSSSNISRSNSGTSSKDGNNVLTCLFM